MIDLEGRRLFEWTWFRYSPLLGLASNSNIGLQAVATALAEPFDRGVPNLLKAAVEVDRLTAAAGLFKGVAVIVPADAPLSYPSERDGAEETGRRDDVFQWLGYHGPLATLTGMLPEHLSDRILAWHVFHVADAGRRTHAIQAMGTERFFSALALKAVQEDRFGKLYLVGPTQDPSAFVEVADATIAPDGTRQRYWRSVPPHVTTAREAVAWTFGSAEEDYDPVKET
jgi:hypothetical protein